MTTIKMPITVYDETVLRHFALNTDDCLDNYRNEIAETIHNLIYQIENQTNIEIYPKEKPC